MIIITINQTAKKLFDPGEFRRVDNDEFKTETINDAWEYLKKRYGKSKRTKMYIDKDGKSRQRGWIYHYRLGNYIMNDWVSLTQVEGKAILLD